MPYIQDAIDLVIPVAGATVAVVVPRAGTILDAFVTASVGGDVTVTTPSGDVCLITSVADSTIRAVLFNAANAALAAGDTLTITTTAAVGTVVLKFHATPAPQLQLAV